jgi:hypothetical protein
LYFAAVHRFEQGFARGEMPVKRADTHSGSLRDGFEASLWTASTEDHFCRLEDPLAIPNSIGAWLSRAFLGPPNADRQISTS